MTNFCVSRMVLRVCGLMCALILICVSSPVMAVGDRADSTPEAQNPLGAPQDLWYFAKQAGMDTVLLPLEEQTKRDARTNQLFFSPWQQGRPSVKAKQFQANLLKKARGYHGETPWSQAAWNTLLKVANVSGYPSPCGPAIVTRHTDLRAMPTAQPLYLEPTAQAAMDFFDFFQYASLPLGTPVYVSHVSADTSWLYVEYPLVSGWVRAEDVALVSKAFCRAYAHGSYAVSVQDAVPLVADSGELVGTSYVGSVFPRAQEPDRIFVPVRQADGTARVESLSPPAGTVVPKPLTLTPANLARIGTAMMGQPYGWGGCNQLRDCSLTTRDIFLPFGLWLPRNSRVQVNSGRYKKIDHLSPEARKRTVLHEAKPFMTLLGFPGHVGLYVGTYADQPVMLHNILGLRTHKAEEFYRHIIGKCHLSTLEVGKNDPQMELSETLLERLRALRHLESF
ncbi:MAG: SH3 domain-containing protein [Desulfovibrionaceae bacterium]